MSAIYKPKIPNIGEQVQLLIANRRIDLYRLPSSSRAYPLAIDKKADFYRKVLRHWACF